MAAMRAAGYSKVAAIGRWYATEEIITAYFAGLPYDLCHSLEIYIQ